MRVFTLFAALWLGLVLPAQVADDVAAVAGADGSLRLPVRSLRHATIGRRTDGQVCLRLVGIGRVQEDTASFFSR